MDGVASVKCTSQPLAGTCMCMSCLYIKCYLETNIAVPYETGWCLIYVDVNANTSHMYIWRSLVEVCVSCPEVQVHGLLKDLGH